LLFATTLHSTQWRKGTGIPYVAHLLAVTLIVLENGGNEDEAIAGLLHDAIEDQGGAVTREEIHRPLWRYVVAIVDGCADADVILSPPLESTQEAISSIRAQASPSVAGLLSRQVHNARALLTDYQQLGDENLATLPRRQGRTSRIIAQ